MGILPKKNQGGGGGDLPYTPLYLAVSLARKPRIGLLGGGLSDVTAETNMEHWNIAVPGLCSSIDR